MESGKVWSAIPEETGKETHLYSVTLDDGQRVTELEEFIAGVEGKAAAPFAKLLAGEDVVGQCVRSIEHKRPKSSDQRYQ